MFDVTDMNEVKRHLGGFQCFAGNVPGGMLIASTPEEVDAYVKQLIADVAGAGGFALAPGVVTNEAKPESMHAMIEAGKKYGAEISPLIRPAARLRRSPSPRPAPPRPRGPRRSLLRQGDRLQTLVGP